MSTKNKKVQQEKGNTTGKGQRRVTRPVSGENRGQKRVVRPPKSGNKGK